MPVPSKKIWNHLGQFGGLDIKTSQEPKFWEKMEKLGILIKFQKGNIIVVSEHGIGTYLSYGWYIWIE